MKKINIIYKYIIFSISDSNSSGKSLKFNNVKVDYVGVSLKDAVIGLLSLSFTGRNTKEDRNVLGEFAPKALSSNTNGCIMKFPRLFGTANDAGMWELFAICNKASLIICK